MGLLEFIAKLFEHLAWPAVVLSALWLLRRDLPQLVDRLHELDYGNKKITWHDSMTRAKILASNIEETQPIAEQVGQLPRIEDGRHRLEGKQPDHKGQEFISVTSEDAGAIEIAHSTMRTDIDFIVAQYGRTEYQKMYREFVHYMMREYIIDFKLWELFRELNRIYFEIRNSREREKIPRPDIDNYQRMCKMVVERVKLAADSAGPQAFAKFDGEKPWASHTPIY